MLSAGLLIASGGGAIATADTDASGSAPPAGQTAATTTTGTGTVSEPVTAIASTLNKTVQDTIAGVTATIGQLVKPTTQVSATQIVSKADPPASATDNKEPSPPVTETTVAHDVVTPAPETTPLTTNSTETTPAPNTPTPATTTAVPLSNTVAPTTGNPPPPTNTVASLGKSYNLALDPITPVLQTVLPPVTRAVATVASVIASLPMTLAALPYSPTPIRDVLIAFQAMLTTVADAVLPLAQLPSDLYSLFGVSSVARPTVIGAGGSFDTALLTGADSPVLLPPAMFAQALPASGDSTGSLFGAVVAPPTLGGIATTGLSNELSLSGVAPLAPAAVSPANARSFLEHAVTAIVVPASLSALAALALPGIGGLLVLCAVGIRVGYRQAKAAFAMRTTGIARFAGPGPLGVVRSGSLVSLHRPRPARTTRPQVVRAASYLLDEAA